MTEIPLKQWIVEEAIRTKSNYNTVYRRLQRGKYPQLKLRKVKHSVVLVEVEGQ